MSSSTSTPSAPVPGEAVAQDCEQRRHAPEAGGAALRGQVGGGHGEVDLPYPSRAEQV
ncbi:hypothetical protein [Deinococcus humi]|uniref:Uncharacterized protein n=1 Tax=Deinococcus humi TaxID=662880 RepID=A0A7W8JVG6_9DEIO|nr:hypothetical protein [Deinococcus humi]MBB5363966.1 hypothetical protein [Deinococcus humi]